MNIERIDLDARNVTVDGGLVLPITNFFFAEDDDCDDPREAIAFVAGDGDVWVSVSMADCAHLIALGDVRPLDLIEGEA